MDGSLKCWPPKTSQNGAVSESSVSRLDHSWTPPSMCTFQSILCQATASGCCLGHAAFQSFHFCAGGTVGGRTHTTSRYISRVPVYDQTWGPFECKLHFGSPQGTSDHLWHYQLGSSGHEISWCHVMEISCHVQFRREGHGGPKPLESFLSWNTENRRLLISVLVNDLNPARCSYYLC